MPQERIEVIKNLLTSGKGIRERARETSAGTATVQRIKKELRTIEAAA